MTPQEASKEATQTELERCTRLLANEDFAWFLQYAVVDPYESAEGMLHGLSTDAVSRDRAAHISDALKQIKDFVQHRKEISERSLKSAAG